VEPEQTDDERVAGAQRLRDLRRSLASARQADPIAQPGSQSSLFRLLIATSTKLFFDEKLEPNFGAHVVENLSMLYSDFNSRRGGGLKGVRSNPSTPARVDSAEPFERPLSTQGKPQAENKKGYLQVVHTADRSAKITAVQRRCGKRLYSARFYSHQERSAGLCILRLQPDAFYAPAHKIIYEAGDRIQRQK